MEPFIVSFVVLFGPVLLFQLVVGAQNLWWKTEEQPAPIESESTEKEDPIKHEAKKGFVSKGPRMAISIIGRILLFLALPLIVQFFLVPRDVGYFNQGVLIVFTLIANLNLPLLYIPPK